MDVSTLARHAITGFGRGTLEIKPGLSRMLNLMGRLMPAFTAKQLGKSVALLAQTRVASGA
jgi:hypothetical protein